MLCVAHLQNVDRRQQDPCYIQGHIALTKNNRCIATQIWTQLHGKKNLNYILYCCYASLNTHTHRHTDTHIGILKLITFAL